MRAPKYLTVSAKAPSGTGVCEFRIANDLIQHIQRYWPAHKFYEAKLVKEIVESPTVIFEGLRDEQEKGLCYAGVPSGRYTNKGNKLPPPPKKTFVVFAASDYKVFQWRWEDSDLHLEGYPVNWKTRFARQIWPKT